MATFTRFLSPPSLCPPSLPFPLFLSPRFPSKVHLPKTPLSLPSISRKQKKLAVSIAPIEQAPFPDFNFSDELSRLVSLQSRLKLAKTPKEKSRILDSDPRVRDFFKFRKGWVSSVLSGFGVDEVVLIKCLVAAGQEHVLGVDLEGVRGEKKSGLRNALYVLGDMVEKWSLGEEEIGEVSGGGEQMKKLLKRLREIEEFYGCVGGIIG